MDEVETQDLASLPGLEGENMRENLTPAIEDYLKSIYGLTSEGERVTTNRIATRLGVTAASVTGMLQKMAAVEPPLVDYQKHRGVTLTEAGRSVALEIIRHHRLLEMFLHKALGYSWDEVHSEADRLEHVISEEFEERIAQALGNPARDPHGEVIPTRDFRLPPESDVRLGDLRSGQRARVQRVEDPHPALLRYLDELGLQPETEILVLGYSPFDDTLRLQVVGRGEPVVVGPRITQCIFVEAL
jgi:DtxR family transcriptional regulator, Mn-dependent transcriptional regulator